MNQIMNQTKFTPGPWTHTPLQQKIWANDGDLHVATVADLPWVNNKSDWLTEEANARLISKAPEMFEALDWFSEYVAQHPEWAESYLGHADSPEREWFYAVRSLLNSIQDGGGK